MFRAAERRQINAWLDFSVAPPGLSIFLALGTWGSRPRLNICRPFGARAGIRLRLRFAAAAGFGFGVSAQPSRSISELGVVVGFPGPCVVPSGAPEARKMNSLGREPQVLCRKYVSSRGAATDQRVAGFFCRPSGAFHLLGSGTWGSRPRLNICRPFGARAGNNRAPTKGVAAWTFSTLFAVTLAVHEGIGRRHRWYEHPGRGF